MSHLLSFSVIGGSQWHSTVIIRSFKLLSVQFRPTENVLKGTEARCGFPRLHSWSISHYHNTPVRTKKLAWVRRPDHSLLCTSSQILAFLDPLAGCSHHSWRLALSVRVSLGHLSWLDKFQKYWHGTSLAVRGMVFSATFLCHTGAIDSAEQNHSGPLLMRSTLVPWLKRSLPDFFTTKLALLLFLVCWKQGLSPALLEGRRIKLHFLELNNNPCRSFKFFYVTFSLWHLLCPSLTCIQQYSFPSWSL